MTHDEPAHQPAGRHAAGGAPRLDDQPSAAPRFDTFISFCSADRLQPWFGRSIDIVAELKTALERYRHPGTARRMRVCTYDEDFELGLEVRKVIAQTIAGSASVVLLSGRGAGTSAFVRFEVDTAREVLGEDKLLPALVDRAPYEAFPDLFAVDAHGADLSAVGCKDVRSWRRRVELEAAKIAARTWDLPLARVRDRFVLERRRVLRRRVGSLVVAFLTLLTAAAAGYHQFRQRQLTRELAVHQRYASEMAAVQRAWSAGNVDVVRSALAGWQHRSDGPDPRSFDWRTYALVATAQRMALHGDEMTSLAAAPAAPLFAFATTKAPVVIWDAEKRTQLAALHPATVGSRSVVFEPNGRWLAAATASGIVRWDLEARSERIVAAPGGDAFVVLVALDDRVLAVTKRGDLYGFDGSTPKLRGRAVFKVSADFRLSRSGSGRYLVGLGADEKVQVVDLERRSRPYVRQIDGLHASHEFATRGETAIFAAGERLAVLDLASGVVRNTPRLTNGRNLTAVAVSTDGKAVAAGDPANGGVVLWHPGEAGSNREWRDAGALRGYKGWVRAIRFLPRSTLLVAGSGDGGVRVWDVERVGRRVSQSHQADIASLVFVDHTHDVVSLDRDGLLRRWEGRTLAQRWARNVESASKALALGRELVAVAGDGVVRFFRLDDGREVRSTPGWEPLASGVDGDLLAFQGTGDGEVIVEGPAGSRHSFRVGPGGGSSPIDITAIAFGRRGDILLIATADGHVRGYDLRRHLFVWTIEAHKRVIHALALSPDGTSFATASSDRTVKLWRTVDGAEIGTLQADATTVGSLAFSPDGRTLVSGAQDGVIRMWNVHARLETVAFHAHARDLHPGVTALAFSGDGAHLASGGAMGTMIVWDADTRSIIPELAPSAR
ncbi:MAG: hypothetical protein JNN03_12745 [Rubrivivax sp.]|nr:hypothetical protein [Rubrivivax sp.]